MRKYTPMRGIVLAVALAAVGIAFGGMLFLALPQVSTAAVIDNPLGQGATFQTAIKKIADFALAIVGPIAVVMCVVAGYLYTTGGGNPEQIKKAHKTLAWALVGFGIVILAQGADLLVKNILGVK